MATQNMQIAVIGIGCWYPGAANPKLLWENILARRRQFRTMPDVRLPLAEYQDDDRLVADKTYGRRAAVIDGYEFDWSGHRIPKSTSDATDIAHWLALDVALQMLDDAGYKATDLPRDTTQVIVGNTLTGEFTRANTLRLRWPYVEKTLKASAQHIGLPADVLALLSQDLEQRYKSVFAPVNEDTLAGGLANTIAGRICNYLNVHGGGYTVDGACASSLIAVHAAATALANHSSDFAIAGGVDISLDPFELVGFAKTGALTPGEMAVYDKQGNGFIPGEGCGFVGLKRLADARRDGNKVYAILDGWGMSSDGKGGITAPSATGQSLALQRAYACAGIAPEMLDFIEGHGTGTAVGDRTELLGIAKALANDRHKRRCGVTSFKSVVGHTKAAAGVGAFIKAVIAVNQRVLPPTAGCTQPHDVFSKEGVGLYPLRRGLTAPVEQQLRAGVSAMGFGGINVHVTLTSADPAFAHLQPSVGARAAMASPQDSEAFCLSAASADALRTRLGQLRADAEGASSAELADLAAQVNEQNDPNAAHRASLTCSSPRELSEKLRAIEQRLAAGLRPGEIVIDREQRYALSNGYEPVAIGFLFPGQGSQKLNMSRALVERFDWARELVANADRWAAELGTDGLSNTIYIDSDRTIDSTELEAARQQLKDTRLAQPAIVLASLLWLRYLERLGINAECVLGHSLGELTAFHAAGAFDERTVIQLATLRGQLMAAGDGAQGAMLSLACDRAAAERAMNEVPADGVLVIANLNGPTQTVVSGDVKSIEALRAHAQQIGIPAQLLPVSNAFHSPLVSGAATRLRDFTGVPETPIRIDKALISSCDGRLLSGRIDLRRHFADQIVCPVDFVRALSSMRQRATWLIEVGPGRVLSSLAQQADADGPSLALPLECSAESFQDLNWVIALVHASGRTLNWRALYENRVLRAFTPATALKFIVNPCERQARVSSNERINATSQPQPMAQSGGATRAVPMAQPSPTPVRPAPTVSAPAEASPGYLILAGLAAKLTGFALSSMKPSLRLLDDLNLDSIKVASLIGDACLALGVEAPAEPTALAQFSLAEIATQLTASAATANAAPAIGSAAPAIKNGTASLTQPPVAQQGDAAAIELLLLELATRHTGFERSTLRASASLTDDLNLDSIKVAALISEAEARLEIAEPLDPADAARLTISETAVLLADRQKSGTARLEAQTQLDPPRAPAGVVPTTQSPTKLDWVRAFAMRLVPTELGGAAQWAYEQQSVAIQCDIDERPLAAALAAQLTKLGANTVILDAVQLERDPRSDIDRIIVLLPRCVSSGSSASDLVATSVARLRASAVTSARQRRCQSLTYVQFGGMSEGLRAAPGSFATSCSSAFAASIHLERPDLLVRVIDLHPGQDIAGAVALVLAEQSGEMRFCLSHYGRDQRRHVSEPSVLVPALYPQRQIRWTSQDVMLVTGGAKGITAECALAFGKATGARLVLVGSSSHDPAGLENAEVAQTLARCAAAGVLARYRRCDLSDPHSVLQLVAEVRSEFGPITGVIHGAGLNRPRRVEQVEERAAIEEVSPKLRGLLNLCEALHSNPPKLFVGMSSIIGITGMPGNAWYAFSNEALNVCLQRFGAFHPGTAVVALAYSVWSGVGMGAKMGSEKQLAKLGVSPVSVEAGVAHFLSAALGQAGALQIAVTGRLGSLDTWRPTQSESPRADRFLENVTDFDLGIELTARTRLTLEDDPYLKDHYYRGVYLFPTVFGLEAMAQATAKVLGLQRFESLKVVDVSLTRPIVVSAEKGAEIEVRAQVIERKQVADPLSVRVGIAVDQTSFKRDHFSATFVIESQARHDVSARELELPRTALDLDPKTELYGGLLFQGPMFQRLERVWKMDSNGSLISIRRGATAGCFSDRHRPDLILGDPLRRDVLLQSAQLSIKGALLPIGIDELILHDLNSAEATPVVALNRLTARNELGPVCEIVAASMSGKLLERMRGYRLKQMELDETAPEPEDWADPNRRDAGALLLALTRHCTEFGLPLPNHSLSFEPHLSELDQTGRRLREVPRLQKLGSLMLPNGPAAGAFSIDWREDGKPFVSGLSEDELGVSISHDRSQCLCVVGPGPQGCDIESVLPRSREEWLRLLRKERGSLLDELVASGDTLDEAGTRLWCAHEALTKAFGTASHALDGFVRHADGVAFSVSTGTDCRILTFSMALTRPPRRMFAFLASGRATASAIQSSASHSLGRGPAKAQVAHELLHFGPGPGPELRHRFRTTFRDACGLRGNLRFDVFADWMGNLRELAIAGVAKQLIPDFSSGKWGMVTNYSNIQILRDVSCLELLEGRMRVNRAYGKFGSSVDLDFDWSYVGPEGKLEQVARANMGTTWVEIIGHGAVEVSPFPGYMEELIKSYLASPLHPASSNKHPLQRVAPEPTRFGEPIYIARNAPTIQPELTRTTLHTTSVESNVVGNIYYSNYYHWQQQIIERFLHEVASTAASKTPRGELSCTFSGVSHLREAMPFDSIEVVMALRGLYRRGVELHFDFYKLSGDGQREKLAVGEYQGIWVGESRRSEELPPAYLASLTEFLSAAAQ